MVAAGIGHSLYYIGGLIGGGWEKEAWNFLQVGAGLGLAGLGWWILLWRRKYFAGRSLLLLRLAQCVIGACLLIFLITEALIWNGGRAETVRQSDYVLILGARVRGETVTLSLRDRLEKGIAYLEKFPGTPVILSGGQGPGEDITEAEAMKRYLVGRGVPPTQLILEEKSTSTEENLKFTRALLEAQGVDVRAKSFTLITNDFHMFRSVLLAKDEGFSVFELPASTPPYTLPKAYTREFAALIKGYVLDR